MSPVLRQLLAHGVITNVGLMVLKLGVRGLRRHAQKLKESPHFYVILIAD